MKKIKVGVIGCGYISSIYLVNAKKFDVFEIIACADLDLKQAKQQAEKFDIPHACSTEELLADNGIDLVINLTTPAVHERIALATLNSGKHLYSEKPLSIDCKSGKNILDKANEKGLLVGNAPDTFLGGGIQTCKKLIDDGWIGNPVSAVAFMMHHGHEHWHPNPSFYYEKGGGPLFDMGPYYITALIALLGRVNRVAGMTKITFSERTVTSEPKYGEEIQVETPTQVNGILNFDSGVIASIITSFDTWDHNLPNIEIYGTEGSMIVPDPDTFGGPVYVRRKQQESWTEFPLTHGFNETKGLGERGLGVAEMASAILMDRIPRVNGSLVYHVLDVMQGIHEAANQKKHYDVTSNCSRPESMPMGINYLNFNKLMGY